VAILAMPDCLGALQALHKYSLMHKNRDACTNIDEGNLRLVTYNEWHEESISHDPGAPEPASERFGIRPL
jgi:hypothetical protein